MNTRIYDIDFRALVRWMVPQPLRQALMLSWVYALAKPLINLYMDFMRNRKANLYRLAITPQVCYLQKMLNDRFDFTLRRIRISDPVWHQPWYAFQENELKPVIIGLETENKKKVTWTEAEAGAFTVDFIALVPGTLVFNMDEMKALLNIYKLATKTYKIDLV